MPRNKMNIQLADEFAEFFIEKIHRIRQQFTYTDAYISESSDIPHLSQFSPLTEKEVGRVINSMQSKSCELDAIPTSLLKRLIDKCLPHITKIVNISLTEGIFSDKWKVAIVRHLLKKASLALINKNYRPVSNLSFLSKLVEKCVLLQFNCIVISTNLYQTFSQRTEMGTVLRQTSSNCAMTCYGRWRNRR